MTFLPIVERELRIAARLAATYRNRTIAAGLVMLAASVVRLITVFASNSQAGVYMFRFLSFLTLIFCVLEGVRKTADCLSEEKREGTLGLLFLTDLKGYDVVLGKLVGTSLSSVYGLIGILPVLSLPLLVGGVMPGEYWRMVLALANILFFSLSAGMFVSAWSRQESRAMAGTLCLVLIFIFVPKFLRISDFAPTHAYSRAFALNYAKDIQGYWRSLGITQALSWFMLGGASFMLPRWWEDTPAGTRFSWRRHGSPGALRNDPQREELRQEMLTTNPAFWLAARDFGRRIPLWILAAVVAVCGAICLFNQNAFPFPALLGVIWLVNFIVKMRVASQACHCLAEARRNNALEMLLATPLTVNEIINGQILALRRMFMGPVIALMIVEAIAGLAGLLPESNGRDATPVAFLMFCVIYFAVFILDIVAVSWAGMWYGLTSKKETQAITKTILLVLVLPYSSFLACWFGIVIFIGIPIFWISWCSSRLKTEFRTIATQRYTPPASGSGWLPTTGVPRVPPIITS